VGRLTVAALAAAAGVATLPGCGAGPIERRAESELRRALAEPYARELAEAQANPQRRRPTPPGDESRLEIRADHLEQVQRETGVPAYLEDLGAGLEVEANLAKLLGENLYGQTHRTAGVSLQKAILAATQHNLDVQLARFGPAVREAGVVAAEAEFDWTFSAGVDWRDTDTPQVGPGFLGLGSVLARSQDVTGSAGLTRRLTTGGTLGLGASSTYADERESAFGVVGSPDPATGTGLSADLTQPIGRGFGSEANLAAVRLARNAERAEIHALRGTLITTLTQVEEAYWDLVQASSDLMVAQRLLDRGVQVRDEVRARRVQDARQAQVADAVARVERRRGDLIRAQTAVRRASDRLKLLVNDPDLPLGDELLLLPVDRPVDESIEFSLVDALTTAIENRPELHSAVLAIDDASIRQTVARNLARPRVDLRARVEMLTLDDSWSESAGDIGRGEFIDNFLLGVFFEQPIGNRAAEAGVREARLLRMRSVVAYRAALREIIADVRTSLDNVLTNYRLIEQARLGRIAQGEALRALQVEKDLTDRGYTVERLNIELNQQEALAQAETAEARALIDYNRALAQLSRATGSTLDRNRIDFVVPDINQLEPGTRALDYKVGPEGP
jgi:outer membrane protein TolC